MRKTIKDTVAEVVKHEVTSSFAGYKVALPKAIETVLNERIKLKDIIKDTVVKSVWSEVASLIQDKKTMLTVREMMLHSLMDTFGLFSELRSP